MERFGRLGTVVVVLGCALALAAQEQGAWRAASKTARGITGDVAFGGEKISINFSSFPVAQIRELQPAEITAAFSMEGSAGGSGSLFRTSIPANKKFLNKNTLCGSEETQWVASYVTGKELRLAFFSGAKMPVFTAEAMGSSTDLCGTFAYLR